MNKPPGRPSDLHKEQKPMSTMRYSGELRIRITYKSYDRETNRDGRNSGYHCFIRGPGGKGWSCFVGAPAVLSHAVDSVKAFDEVAHAAISFAVGEDADGIAIHPSPKLDGSGWHIGRSPSKAYPYPAG